MGGNELITSEDETEVLWEGVDHMTDARKREQHLIDERTTHNVGQTVRGNNAIWELGTVRKGTEGR
jgi:hypothetical protein